MIISELHDCLSRAVLKIITKRKLSVDSLCRGLLHKGYLKLDINIDHLEGEIRTFLFFASLEWSHGFLSMI